MQLLNNNQPPRFTVGLKSCEAKINESHKFTVQGTSLGEVIRRVTFKL